MADPGSSQSFTKGVLRRQLATVTLANLNSGITNDGTDPSFRLILRNLFSNLRVMIAAGIVANVDETPIEAAAVPTGAATLQLTPRTNFGDASPMFLRPLFQDPTMAPNENHPLPQNIPYSWEFNAVSDDVVIDLVTDHTLFASSSLSGRIVVQVTIQYDSSYWDTQAIMTAFSRVSLIPCEPVIIGTGSG